MSNYRLLQIVSQNNSINNSEGVFSWRTFGESVAFIHFTYYITVTQVKDMHIIITEAAAATAHRPDWTSVGKT